MINLTLNGTPTTLPKPSSLKALLDARGHTDESFAVAVNNRFIPRQDYEKTLLKEGDCIDIVIPMQGG